MKTAIVIPARLKSTRLPRKLLLNETGKTLIQHTYEAACQSKLASTVIVAADDDEIVACVRGFGGNVRLTDPAHKSGTCRVAEVAKDLDGFDVIVNVQGDEPELSGQTIDHAINTLLRTPKTLVSTLATPVREKAAVFDPSVVKVVFDQAHRALYFSRSPIPFAREWNDDLLQSDPPTFFQHIGLYVFRPKYLQRLVSLPMAKIEMVESLEQLRILNEGTTILVGIVEHRSAGIDTPEDYAAFVRRQLN